MPNDPSGPFGARTYATSSKVHHRDSDQFSIRVDHRIPDKAQFFARFNLNNVNGPLTNPSQTAIDPSFAFAFFDRQRNFGHDVHADAFGDISSRTPRSAMSARLRISPPSTRRSRA